MSKAPKKTAEPVSTRIIYPESEDLVQGSDAWHALRCGIPTASMFGTIMATGKGGGESKTRTTYLHKLAGEILTGQPAENYSNQHMQRGNDMEAEAREYYAFTHGVELERVAFIRNGKVGASPDSLIKGQNGALEVKTALPHILIPMLLKNEFPPEHKAQCQGIMLVGELDFIDIEIYWPKMPKLVVRAERDEPYLFDLAEALGQFDLELRRLVEKLRSMGQ